MDFKVIYTEPALKDLEDVVSWSWTNHEATTERFANSLLNHIDLLKTAPYLGVQIDRSGEIRRLTHWPMHIYYRVNDSSHTVEILHFWHAKRNPPRF
ncbi:MAG: type II toxin-antitoxin system RelE/ParE family toxin [Acidobacteriia bacterium]|nr:type II toxin-antitoxin system RelE/ParE family toxin [Terriglobia bacterium]